MKNKILTFVIGVLVGAIIASAGFIIYNKNHKRENSNKGPMGGTPPQIVQQDGNNQGTPPTPPDAQNFNDANNAESQNTSNTESNS